MIRSPFRYRTDRTPDAWGRTIFSPLPVCARRRSKGGERIEIDRNGL
ncbi:hypothetical protein [Natrarchaeobius oligotrophus]|nr:hypothetical protein [Natrarchaeobius chitinivorans]